MYKRTVEEKKELLKKLFVFCKKNDLPFVETITPDIEKYPLEVTVTISNWKNRK